VNGRWVKGPGAALFRAAQAKLGELPLVAENLGVITPEVEAIRDEFGFPGMAVLQFAFGTDSQAPTFRPHNYPRGVVAYSGTHDSDTTVGWWSSAGRGESTRSDDDIQRERDFAMRYLNTDGREIQLGVHSRAAGIGSRYGFVPIAGCAGIRHRGADESAGDDGRQLALAVSGGGIDA
jgi:4-alpha-glucanotransferase